MSSKFSLKDKIVNKIQTFKTLIKTVPNSYYNYLSILGFVSVLVVTPLLVYGCTELLNVKRSKFEILIESKVKELNKIHPSSHFELVDNSCLQIDTLTAECNLLKTNLKTRVKSNYRFLCISTTLHNDNSKMICEVYNAKYELLK